VVYLFKLFTNVENAFILIFSQHLYHLGALFFEEGFQCGRFDGLKGVYVTSILDFRIRKIIRNIVSSVDIINCLFVNNAENEYYGFDSLKHGFKIRCFSDD